MTTLAELVKDVLREAGISSMPTAFSARKVLAVLLCASLLLTGWPIAVPVAYAAVPQFLNYQGKLGDAAGNPLTGTYSFRFKFFATETGGSAVFSEDVTSTNALSVANGIYSVQIGSVTAGGIPAFVFDSTPVYLEVDVNLGATLSGAETLAPRERIVGSPFSWHSLTTEKLGTGVAIATFTSAGQLTLPGNLTASSGTFTLGGANQFSLNTSSGIIAGAGVYANFFVGNGSGITGVTASGVPAQIAVSTIDATATTPFGGIVITSHVYLSGGRLTVPAANTSLANIQQSVALNGLETASTFGGGTVYWPGLTWFTTDNNPTRPKAGVWGYGDGSGSRLFFGTSNSFATGITNSALAIDSAGNVGVGVTSPATLFQAGALSATSGALVGVGLTNPAAKFDVFVAPPSLANLQTAIANSGHGAASTYGGGTVYWPGLTWYTTDDNPTRPKAGVWAYGDISGSRLFFGTSNSFSTGITNSALTIDQLGRLGVGVTSPGVSLEVNGQAQFGNTGTKSGFYNAGGLFLAAGSSVTLSGAAGFLVSQSSITTTGAYFGDGSHLTGVLATDVGSPVTMDLVNAKTITTNGGITISTHVFLGGASRLGVGTTAPVAALHVSSANAVAASTPLLVSSGTAAGQQLLALKGDGTLQLAQAGTSGAPAINWSLNGTADGDTGIYRPAADSLGFATAGNLRVTIANTAVTLAPGIGLSLTGSAGTVAAQSSVTASAFFGDGSQLTGITATTVGSPLAVDVLSAKPVTTNGGISISSHVFISGASVRLGVGTTTPATTLDVQGGVIQVGAGGSNVQLSANATGGLVQPSGTGLSLVYNALTGGRHEFDVNGSERMRLDSTGLLGVGTSSPLAELHVSSANVLSTGTPLLVSSGTAAGQQLLALKGDGSLQLSQAGTAGAPAINWALNGTADGDTGIYRPAADSLGFATAGNLRMTIANTAATLASGIALNLSGTGGFIAAQSSITTTGAFFGDGSHLTGVTATPPAEIAVSTIDATATTPYGGIVITSHVFLNNGNLGIGTTAPGLGIQLDATGTARFGGATGTQISGADLFTASTNSFLRLRGSSAGTTQSALLLYGHLAAPGASHFEMLGGTPSSDVAVGNANIAGANAFAGAAVNTGGGDVRVYGGNASAGGIQGDVILAHNGTIGIGSVGVGTPTPTALLHVSSANAVATSTPLLVSSGTAAGQQLLAVKGDGRIQFSQSGTAASPALNWALNGSPDGDMGIYRTAADSLGFATAATLRLTIANAGVALAANTPLNLSGATGNIIAQSSITTTGAFFGDGSQLTGITATTVGSPIAVDIISAKPVTTNGGITISSHVFITPGNLGIGTFSPSSTVHVRGSGARVVTVETTSTANEASVVLQATGGINDVLYLNKYGSTAGGTQAGIALSNATRVMAGASAAHMLMGTITNNPLHILTGNVERIRVTGGGLVGVGTTNPAATLHAVGPASTQDFAVVGDNSATTSGSAVLAGVAGIGGGSGYGVYGTGGAAGIYGKGVSGSVGVFGETDGGASSYFGVLGQTLVGVTGGGGVLGFGYPIGVNGEATGVRGETFRDAGKTGTHVGVRGAAHDGSGNATAEDYDFYAETSEATGGKAIFNGRVGIGVTNPSTRLHLLGTNFQEEIIQTSSVGGSAQLTLRAPGTPNDLRVTMYGSSASGTYADGTPLANSGGLLTQVGASRLLIGGNADTYVVAGSQTRAKFTSTGMWLGKLQSDTAAAQLEVVNTGGQVLRASTTTLVANGGLYVNNNNQVGIGNSSPGAQLDVAWNLANNLNPVMQVRTLGANSVAAVRYLNAAANTMHAGITGNGDFAISGNNIGQASDLVRVQPGGNVGIGITSPIDKLHVVGAGSVYVGVQNTGSSQAGLELINTVRDWYLLHSGGIQPPGSLSVFDATASTVRMMFSTDGRVAVGTGNAAATAQLQISSASATAADSLLLVSSGTAAGQDIMVIKGDGKVGIDTMAPTAKFVVNEGSIFLDGSSAAGTQGGIWFRPYPDGGSGHQMIIHGENRAGHDENIGISHINQGSAQDVVSPGNQVLRIFWDGRITAGQTASSLVDIGGTGDFSAGSVIADGMIKVGTGFNCNANTRGSLRLVTGIAGVPDRIEMCSINNGGVYSWTSLGIGGPQVYSQYFTAGTSYDGQCEKWENFRMQLGGTYTNITIRGNNGQFVTCAGPNAQTLCDALRTGAAVGPIVCGGLNWRVSACGGVALNAAPADPGACACASPAYIVRPCINSLNWGGLGTTCGSAAQTLGVVCN